MGLLNSKVTLSLNNELYKACTDGDFTKALLSLKKGANYVDDGLFIACEHGHINIINLMIENGADEWNCGLAFAYEGGHIDIVIKMIEKGASNFEIIKIEDKQRILDMDININLVKHDSLFTYLIQKQHMVIQETKKIADEILQTIYKDKQIYDKNVINLIAEYMVY